MAAAFQLAVEAGPQGPDDAATLAEQVQGLGDQLADAGLAIGSGDTHEIQAAAGLAIEAPGDGRKLASQPLDGEQFGAAGIDSRGAFRFVRDSSGAASDGIGDMVAAVVLGAGNRQEQVTRAHLAAVQGQFTDQGGAFGLGQQLIQWHGHQIRPPCR